MSRLSLNKNRIAEKVIATLISFLLLVMLIPIGVVANADVVGENPAAQGQDGGLPAGGNGAGNDSGAAAQVGSTQQIEPTPQTEAAQQTESAQQTGPVEQPGATQQTDPAQQSSAAQQNNPEQQAETSVVVGFAEHSYTDPVDFRIHFLEVALGAQKTGIDFPKTVKATLEGGQPDGLTLNVREWTVSGTPGYNTAYDPDTLGSYFFEPVLVLGENLALAPGLELPRLEVVISDAAGPRGKPGIGEKDGTGGLEDSGADADADADSDGSGLLRSARNDGVQIMPLLQNDFGLLVAGDIHIVTVFDGELAQEPEAPTLPSTTFTGWFWDSEYKRPFLGTETMPIENTALFARYESTEQTVTFRDKQGGNVVATTGTETGGQVADPDVYADGQAYQGLGTFLGWHTQQGTNIIPFGFETNIYADTEVFAVWRTTNFTITYDLDGGGGTGISAPTDGRLYDTSGNPLTNVLAPVGGTPTKTVEGNVLTFVGWTANGVSYYPGQYFTPYGDIKMVARYVSAGQIRNLTFNPNGGTVAGGGTVAQWSVQNGDSVLLPTEVDLGFSKAGYNIIGWAASGAATVPDSGYATGSSVASATNTTLFAIWVPKNVAISYHRNDGSANDGYTTGAVLVGTHGALIANAPTVPTRTGYVLDGWYTAASEGTKWNFGSGGAALTVAGGVVENPSTGNETLELFAHWSLKSYAVNINPNYDSLPAVAQSGKQLGGSVDLTRLVRANWTLLGYATSASATTAAYTQTTVDLTANAILSLFTNDTTNTVTLYAVWRENPKYTVTYNFGTGGSGTVTDTGGNAPSGNNYYTGSTVAVKASTGFSRANYHFTGWATASATGPVVYAWSGSAFSPATFNISGNTTLYAVWAINSNTYTVNVASGNGSPVYGGSYTAPGSVNVGDTVAYSAVPSYGYRFAGWSVTGSGVTLNPDATTATGSFVMPDNAVTLSANFAANTVTVNTRSGGSDYSGHGPIRLGTGATGNITPDSGSSSANVVFVGLANGTYHVFDNDRDTGFSVVVADNDPTVVVNYVTYSVAQSGGSDFVKTSTGITLTFSSAVSGLTDSNVILGAGTGTAVKGAFSGSGTSYTVAVSGVSRGTVEVAVSSPSGFFVSNSPQNVTVYKDTTAPTAQVSYRSSGLREFLNSISFGYWFKDTVDVAITATDGSGDGVADSGGVKYYLTTAEITGDAAAVSTAIDNSGTSGTSFTQTPDGKFILYVKVTDKNGNYSIYKDGLVVYTDTTGTAADGKFVKGVTTGDVSITGLDFQGNTVKSVRNVTSSAAVPSGASGYTTGTNTVIVNSTYLNGLTAGSYSFEVEFYPQGATDAAVVINGTTDTPAKSTFVIKVLDSKTVSSVAQFGGQNGKVRSTGILATFNSAVTAPPANAFVVGTGASTAPTSWTVTDGGDTDDKTWALIFTGGSWANNATDFTVATSSWGNYEVSNTGALAVAAMYDLVELGFTPTIDYPNETISGLGIGRTYNIKYGAVSGSFTATASSQAIDAAWFGKSDFQIQAVAEAGDNYVNSAFKPLAIAARPTAPSLTVSSHQTSGSGVEGEIGGVSTAMQYSLSGSGTWTDCPGTTISGLAPGVYNVRVKATSTTFKSLSSTAEIHPYDTIGFGPVYEGYVSADPTVVAKNIHDALIGDPNKTADITGVAFNSGSVDNTAFDLTSSANDSTIGPKPNLTPGEYNAKLDVTRVSYVTGVMVPNVNFTVNGFMAFDSVTVDGSNTAASTMLTVNFLNPVAGLTADSFAISGGAKKASTPNLTPVGPGDATNGYKSYTIAIKPTNLTTNDLAQITVSVTLPTVALHGLSDIYAAQRAEYHITAITDTSAQVRVPRKVNTADQFVYTLAGHDSGFLQFKLLDGAYFPIFEPVGSGEISIVSHGGSATVDRVARVDASAVPDWGYSTYNVYLTNVVAGDVGIAFNNYVVQDADSLRYTLVKGAGATGTRNYFIEADGGSAYKNILTVEGTGAQGPILVDAAAAVVAPQTALLTSVDMDSSPTVQSVLLDGVALDSSMWQVSAGATLSYSYDGGAAVSVNQPMVLTLKEGFVNTNGDHRLEVIFSPDSSYLYGLLDVSGIADSRGIGLANADARDLAGLNNHIFASLPFGYVAGDLAALDVSVLNTGNQATGALSATLSGAGAGSFELVQNSAVVGTASIASIVNLGSADGVFSVRPKTGLVKGATYTATVTVGAATGNSTGIAPASFTVNFTVSNTAPVVVSGQGTQSGSGAPPSYNGWVPVDSYSVDLSTTGWFSDVDSVDTLGYSVVSEDADGAVGISGSTLTFEPNVRDAGLNRTIVVKANDGTADSGNVTITVAVAKAVPSVQMSAQGKPYGQSLTMTASVFYSGGATPTGIVDFYDGSTLLTAGVALTAGSNQSSSVAEFSTSALAGGSHTLEARYNGDAVYKSYATDNSIMGTITTTVTRADQSIVMADPGNKTYGDAAFGLSLATPGAGSGAVSYVSDDTSVLTIVDDTATIVGVGSVNITATKAADGNYNGATSNSVTIAVGQKELTVSVAVADKVYDGTKVATFSPAPSLVGVVGSDDVTLTAGTPEFASVGSANATSSGIVVNFTTAFSISGAKQANYTLTQPTGITGNITQGFAPVNGTHYSTTALAGAAGDVKWTGGAFVVTPLAGYQISTGGAYPGDFSGTPNLSSTADETTAGQTTFYIRNVNTGAISRLGTETYKIDATAPTATVNYKDKGFSAFLNRISNGRFFEATVKVEILGADSSSVVGADSGVAKVEHFTTTQAFVSNAAAEAYGLAIAGWQNGASFNITAADKGKLHLFAKVSDYVGNFSIYYDGLLVYENSVQSGVGATYTKTTLSDVTVDATLKGNAVAGIVNTTDSNAVLGAGDFTFSAAGGSGGLGSITVRGAYLDTLDANTTYSFVVSYRPMGEDFAAAELGSDTPLTTTFTIMVYKQSQSSLAVTGLNSPYIYGDAAASVGASGGNGTGALSFEIVDASVGGVASLTGATASGATLNLLKPGTFKVKATKAGDGSFEPLTATSGVVEVLLAVPQVTLGASGTGIYGGDVNLTATVISRGIGAVPTGSVGFYVDGVHKSTATLDASGKASYAAPLLGVGDHDFEVRYLGNAYYKGYGVSAGATVDPAAHGTAEFTIGKAGQTLVLADPGNKTWGDSDFTLSLSTAGAGSGLVSYSAAPAGILAMTGNSVSIVGTGSVTVTATKAADVDHNGATSSVTITVGKATIPAWTAVAVGAGITYGKTLVNSGLSGWVVNGVGTHAGDVVSGTVTWDAPLYLPDVTAVGGTPVGYAVTFTPTGVDAEHYFALSGTANVTVDKATPVLKTPLSGTPIRLLQSLADSVITGGNTNFGYGTQLLDIAGTWAWDNPGHDGAYYGTTGTKIEAASFTPTDGERFYGINANINLVVFSTTTVVVTPPMVTSLTYGDKLSNSGILAAGSLVHAVADFPPETAITGTWSWSNPDDRATAVGLKAYTAELTFTPTELQADPANPTPGGGYLPTTVDVQITVGPAAPKLTLVSPGTVEYGRPLSDLDLSIYTVEGAFGETITGTLEWRNADVVPSDVLGEVGVYTARALFTPLGSFVPYYTSKEFDIDVLVVVDAAVLDNLAENIVTPLLPALHDEDYLSEKIAELAAALESVNTVRTTVGVTQAAVDAAYDALFAVYESMAHDHPVLEHSADFKPIADTSDGFMVRFKGYFGSVLPTLGVTLDGADLVHTPTAEVGVHDLTKDGELVGTLSAGSARVTFTPEFLGTLADGVHTLAVNFDDGFRSGSGVTTLEIKRSDGSGNGGGSGNGAGNGGVGSAVNAGSVGAGGVGASGDGAPQTGDSTLPWVLVVTLAAAGVAALTWRHAIRAGSRGKGRLHG